MLYTLVWKLLYGSNIIAHMSKFEWRSPPSAYAAFALGCFAAGLAVAGLAAAFSLAAAATATATALSTAGHSDSGSAPASLMTMGVAGLRFTANALPIFSNVSSPVNVRPNATLRPSANQWQHGYCTIIL
jgi:hypothetical protein